MSPTNPLVPQAAIFAVFFVQSFVLGTWLPRIADVKISLQLTEGTLGLVLLALPVGTFAALSIASPVVKRVQPAPALLVALSIWSCIFLLPAAATNALQLAAALGCCGLVVGFLEVASNLEADNIEQRISRRIMSRCHGFWSLGAMSGALLGGPGFASHGVSVARQFLLLWPFATLLSVLAAYTLWKVSKPVQRVATSADPSSKQKRAGVSLPVLLLCVVPAGIMAVEGSFMDWSAVFMREQLNASAGAAGYTFAVFAGVMAVVRLAGDRLAERFGDVTVVRVSGAAAAVGMLLFSTANSTLVALVGAGLSGAGVAIVFPLAMTAVARLDDQHREDNVAYLSIAAFTVLMITPPFVGWIAEFTNLRIALQCLIPGAVLTAVMAQRVKVR